jgi:hypothetical protein
MPDQDRKEIERRLDQARRMIPLLLTARRRKGLPN